jgi:hypothetical protein
MTTEHIHKDVCNLVYNKCGELLKDEITRYTIDIDVEINTPLNKMCKDLLSLIKDDDVFVFDIVYPIPQYSYKIQERIFDLKYVKKIVFEEYYLVINDVKIFYNAIFDFNKRRKW